MKRCDNVWKKYLSDTLKFGIGSDCMENAFRRAISLPKMPCFEYVIILCGRNNINKDLSFDVAECFIEIGKYFQERSRKVKIIISSILPQDECLSVSRIIVCKINDIV